MINFHLQGPYRWSFLSLKVRTRARDSMLACAAYHVSAFRTNDFRNTVVDDALPISTGGDHPSRRRGEHNPQLRIEMLATLPLEERPPLVVFLKAP